MPSDIAASSSDYAKMPTDAVVPMDNIQWIYESPLPEREEQATDEQLQNEQLSRWHLRDVRFPGSVPGWMTLEEGATLALLARDKVVLEIGSYCGRSTVCMAQTARRVYALDWHRGDPAPGSCPSYATLHYMATAILHYGVEDVVVIMAGSSEDVGYALGSGWADMVYVDGGHDYESVKKDTALALRCLKPNGILVFHDWDFITVREAARVNGVGTGKLIGNKLYVVGGSTVGVSRDSLDLELKSLEQQKADIAAQRAELNNREQAIAGAEQMVRHLIAKFEIDRIKSDAVSARECKAAKESRDLVGEDCDDGKPVVPASSTEHA